MSITHAMTMQWEQGNNSLSMRDTFTGESEANVSVSVPDSSTDFEITLGIDISEIKSIVINSDQVVTLETNSGSAADDTFALTADNPLVWNVDSPAANPFSADITALFVTNSSGSAATFNVRCLLDATP
jgi:hypothetical protein